MRFFFCLSLVFFPVLFAGCARFGALPRDVGDNARIVNAWPLFRSIQDKENGIRETQVLWPLFKHRRVDGDSFLRCWPFYLYAQESAETFPFCTEYQCSALSLFSSTKSTDCTVYGLVHFNLLGCRKSANETAFSVYPLWWPNHPTIAIRNERSKARGLLVDVERSETGGFRFLTIYHRPEKGYGFFPFFAINHDSWYILGPLLTRAEDDPFIRILLFETWPVQGYGGGAKNAEE